jgi:hypothetical protein
LDYGPRERDLPALYQGGTGSLALLHQYHLGYLLIGPDEAQYSPNMLYFAKNVIPVPLKDLPEYKLYRVK